MWLRSWQEKETHDMSDQGDEQGSKAYSLYTLLRRYFEPLREHWDKFTPEEQAVVIREVEAFLNSVRLPEGRRLG
jgi:hypothetical protein